MNKHFIGVIFLIFGFILNQCGNKDRISKDDIRGAQKLIRVEFSDKELDTMMNYLNANRKGYDSMRKIHVDKSVSPAMYFDPKPDNFQWPEINKLSDWKLPKSVSMPATDEEIAFLTVADLGYLLQTGKLTSTQLTTLYLKRLKKYSDTLHAVITITEDLALKQAAIADDEIKRGMYRGPLHGIPYGIKDLFAVPGYKTTWGAEPYKDQLLNERAIVVKKLEEAGAVLVAKLTSGALARGDVWFGGKTRNPWDLKQGASGSSAGSASATAAGASPPQPAAPPRAPRHDPSPCLDAVAVGGISRFGRVFRAGAAPGAGPAGSAVRPDRQAGAGVRTPCPGRRRQRHRRRTARAGRRDQRLRILVRAMPDRAPDPDAAEIHVGAALGHRLQG